MTHAESANTARKSAAGFQRRGFGRFGLLLFRHKIDARIDEAGKRQGATGDVIVEAGETSPEANSDAWTLHRHGALLAADGQLKAACVSLRQAAEADPRDARHRFALSEIQQQRGDSAAALAEAARATRCPNAGPSHFHRYGVLLAARGILDQARISLTAAVQGDPGQWRSRVELVDLLDRLGQTDEAIAVAAAGAQAGCHAPRLLRQYGLLLARRGRFAEAKSVLDSARGRGLEDLKHRLAAEWRYMVLRAGKANAPPASPPPSPVTGGQTAS